MSVEITKVQNRAELKQFIRFNYELYKDNAFSVPDLLEDMLDTYNPKKNPAFEFCEAEYFLARRDGKIVGRVACIINHKANRTWNEQTARFGWIDFIDDLEVSGALLRQAEDWAREHHCTKLVGPLGFTDLDAEGMLIDGFDQLSTMSTIYNFPYYPQHLEHYGYTHEIDWVERKIFVPEDGHEADQAKYFRVAEIVRQRLNLRVRKFKSVKEIREGGYLYRVFDVVNKAYAPLFGFSEINRAQVMGSLSHALQKAKGKLFPFGWWHLLKAIYLKRSKIIDLLLVAVLPEYQSKGVNAMLFADIIPIAKEMGFKWAESHPQLETNNKSQDQWKHLDQVVHKRRRCYQKPIEA